MSRAWYQLNVYPSNRNGAFAYVLTSVTGYDLRCEGCRRRRCKKCRDTKKAHVLKAIHAEALPDQAPPGEVVAHALNAMLDEGWRYDAEKNRFVYDIHGA